MISVYFKPIESTIAIENCWNSVVRENKNAKERGIKVHKQDSISLEGQGVSRECTAKTCAY